MRQIATAVAAGDIHTRVDAYDWTAVERQLDNCGWAVLPALLPPDENDALHRRYDDDRLFRSRVVMAKHGFGRGEYKYFNYPLPHIVADLRTAMYRRLASLADHPNETIAGG